jgi:hypothetical protein
MAITIDWQNKLVLSTASIADIVAFKDTIRDYEDDDAGMLYPPIITYKRVDLGGGAYFHAVDAINGYQLKFPSAGNYEVEGNINMPIVPVAGVYVERKTSAAFATVAGTGGSTGPTAAEIADEIMSRLAATTIPVDAVKMNGATIAGDGTSGNLWRGA